MIRDRERYERSFSSAPPIAVRVKCPACGWVQMANRANLERGDWPCANRVYCQARMGIGAAFDGKWDGTWKRP